MEQTFRKTGLKDSYFSYLLLFNFYYMAWALFSSIISIYLIGLGYSAGQASLVVSSSYLVSMAVQPWIGKMADQYGMKNVCSIAFILAAGLGIVFLFCRSLVLIAIFYSLVMTLVNGANPIIEKMATTSPYRYGKIRIWGTIGFAIGTQAAGFLYQHVSPSAIFIAFVVCLFLCIYGMTLTGNDHIRSEKPFFRRRSPRSETELVPQKADHNRVSFRDLFYNHKFGFYLLIFALFNGVNEAMNTFLPSMLTYEGVEPSTASGILSIAVLTQIPMVYFADRFMDRMKSRSLSLIAFSIMLFQMLVYGLPGILDLKEIVIMLLKTQGSMLFIMVNLKIVHSLVSASSQITALAIAATVKNLAAIVFNSLAGNMIDIFGYSACFLTLAVVMIVAIILLLCFRLPAGTDQKLFS